MSFLKYGTLFFIFLLWAMPASGQASLDWAMVDWANGDLANTYNLSNGVDITIEVSTSALGAFTNDLPIGPGGTLVEVVSPYIDGKDPNPSLFGTGLDLGVIFNPDSGEGSSPVLIEVTFSEPVTDVTFEISDIDWAAAGLGEDVRIDQVTITSDNGAAELESKTLDPSFICTAGDVPPACSGDTATGQAGDSVAPDSDRGTLVVSFAQPVSVVTITYSESSGEANPSSRGIGLFATLSEVPVELLSFSVD